MSNTLCTYKYTFSDEMNDIEFIMSIAQVDTPPHWYAYIIYQCKDGYELIVYESDIKHYNTLSSSECIREVREIVQNNIITQRHADKQNGKNTVIGYKQPPIEIQLEAFEPLINSLANEAYAHWGRWYDLDDLQQICKYCMCKLYNNGYYIHKSLLRKTFNNMILSELRHNNRAGADVSLDSLNIDEMFVLSAMIDRHNDELFANAEERDMLRNKVQAQRKIIVDIIGEEAYKRLIDEYTKKQTTSNSRSLVYRLKKRMKSEGYDSFYWDEYLS